MRLGTTGRQVNEFNCPDVADFAFVAYISLRYNCGFTIGTRQSSANGRISIPAKQRQALGIENGSMVVATVQDGELRIRTVRAVLEEIQLRLASSRNVEGGGSEGLIREQREETVREDREYQESLSARRRS
jgi:AbrB family looped-hinge helix DNA binding protein